MNLRALITTIGIASLAIITANAEDFVRNPVGLDADKKYPFKDPTVWGGGLKKVPPAPLPDKFDWHVALLNQIGFDVNEPKRFTAPVSPDSIISVFVFSAFSPVLSCFPFPVKEILQCRSSPEKDLPVS